MKISALISVYKKDNSEYFKNALESLDNQTHKLGEIVLVNDGPLNNKLELPCFTPSLIADNGPLDGFLIKAISIPNDNNSFLILKISSFSSS